MKIAILLSIVSYLYLVGCSKSENPIAQAIDDAYRVCTALNNTGLTSECQVKGWGHTIDVRIDTTGIEARKICDGAVKTISQMTRNFKSEWKLRIYSPFSEDHPLAVCVLR